MSKATTKSFLGVAKETTKGTAVAPTAFIPARNLQPADDIAFLEDKGYRGSAVDLYDLRKGVLFSGYSFDGDVFPDTLGHILLGLFGAVATTGIAPTLVHTFSLLNNGDQQPPAYTITDFMDIEARAFPGSQFSELNLKFTADGTFEYTAKAVGMPSADAATPTAAFSTVLMHPGWQCQAQIAAGNVSIVQAADINIVRSVKPIFTGRNSQSPFKIWVGPMRVTGRLLLIAENDTELNRFINQTTTSVKLTFTENANLETILTMSKVQYVKPTNVVRGKEYVEIDAAFEAIPNTTDAGASAGFAPIKPVLENAVTAY